MRDAAIDTHRSTARGAGRSRSSGAPPLDDMVGEGPVSRSAPRGGGTTSAAVAAQRLGGGRAPGAASRGRGAPRLADRLRGRLPRIKPLKALTVAAFGVALVGIVANAMVFQRGHHPSPLFGLGRSVDGSSDAAQLTAAALPAPVPPVPVERTGTIPQAASAPVDLGPPAIAATPRPAPVHHAAAKVLHESGSTPKAADAARAGAHPRPGHPAGAHVTVGSKVEAKAAAKADPVAKLLAGASHPATAQAKASPTGKAAPAARSAPAGQSNAETAASPASHPHHRLAATAPADGGKPASRTE